jgi:hypothetical protein
MACAAVIHPTEMHGNSFPCPECDEWLQPSRHYLMAVGMASALAAIITAWRWGYRDAAFIYAVGFIFLCFWFGGLFIVGLVIPPKLQRVSSKSIGETLSFHLTDKPDGDKKGKR